MAEKNTHEVTLSGYKASCTGTLMLGTWGSAGMERLHIRALSPWDGMTITAAFINGGNVSTPQLVDTDGYVNVPPSATAEADTRSKIVFYGTDGTSSVYSADLRYTVSDRSDTGGKTAAEPGKDLFTQYIEQTNRARKSAEQAAAQAKSSAGQAEEDAAAAQQAASAAESEAAVAKQSAEDSAQSAAAAEHSETLAQRAAEDAGKAAESARADADRIGETVIYQPGSDFEISEDGTFQLYRALVLSGVSVTPAALEMGSVLDAVTVKWTVNKVPDSVTVNGQEADPAAGQLALSGLALTADTAFTVKAADARMEASGTAWVRFRSRVFWGVGGAELADPAQLKNTKLAADAAAAGGTVKLNAGEGEYLWYCAPGSWRDPVFSVGGFEGGFGKTGTADYRMPNGETVPYALWRSEQAGLGSVTLVIG